jgi:SAM-dependent methyltransferase
MTPIDDELLRYYDAAAEEYDELFGPDRPGRPGWAGELDSLGDALAALPPARTLDVGCGTGFFTRLLPGTVVGLDQSERMLARARRAAPQATFVSAVVPPLPFPTAGFERIVTVQFYGHLDPQARRGFLAEARRVADELVVVDATLRRKRQPIERQTRLLRSGASYEVYKRYFTLEALRGELQGGELLHQGRWMLAVRRRWR